MTTPPEEKQLLRESAWARVYSIDLKPVRFESKFAMDGLEVSADSIKSSWKSFSPEEQFDFALAFAAKPILTSEDEEILSFLMETALPRNICSIIAGMLPQHSDRERVFRFLIDRVENEQDGRANYYGAVEVLNDSRAIPVLKRLYETYRKSEPFVKRGPLTESQFRQLFDYLSCCRALLTLERSKEFEMAIREILTHSDERLRRHAERLLLEQKP